MLSLLPPFRKAIGPALPPGAGAVVTLPAAALRTHRAQSTT
ncbi:hypothetical protein [Streptomyces sp. Root1310]|nr:hypothetical protein [Streptomyces sp. Root1310]